MIPAPGAETSPEKVKIQTLLKIFGGQGPINVNSWSSDSTRLSLAPRLKKTRKKPNWILRPVDNFVSLLP
jgi:hypothetical protein